MAHIAPEGGVYQAGHAVAGTRCRWRPGVATLDLLTPDGVRACSSRPARRSRPGCGGGRGRPGREVAIARVGSLLTVFFRPACRATAPRRWPSDRDAYARFFGAMLDEGVLLPPSQFEAWFISAAHGEAEVAATLAAARKAFAA